jgi:aspartyl-tRNA(Asn)/glutamyl-tRNA(Gln) amidotransferase subunit B
MHYKIYEAIIGLEIHAQLLTQSKIFCGCPVKFGSLPNSNTCPVCLGLPGVLPVLNKKAVEFAIKMGLATNCEIALSSIFARKNYFYPDLPKGYQISQYDHPICYNGWIDINSNGKTKRIAIKRIHLEEDAGKSVHDEKYVDDYSTLIDLNRCGTPLIEIVSEPDMNTPQEAVSFLSQTRKILQYLKICDGNMEEGSLRCDANLSIRLKGSKTLGTKTEVKNMNSFRNVEHALQYEIKRQIAIIEKGGEIDQATLLWDADLNEVREMRSKEESHDYRYFPEPDLVPLNLDNKIIQEIKSKLPELPNQRKNRFITQYNIPEYDCEIVTSSRDLADYFEEIVNQIDDPKLVSNWIMTEVMRVLNEKKIEIKNLSITPQKVAELLVLIKNDTINLNSAKQVFQEMIETNEKPGEIIARLELKQISQEGEIVAIVQKVLESNRDEVRSYKEGKKKIFGFFMGQVMRATHGKANPQLVKKIMEKQLTEPDKTSSNT